MTSSTLLFVVELSSSKRGPYRKRLVCRNPGLYRRPYENVRGLLVHDGVCVGDMLGLGEIMQHSIFQRFFKNSEDIDTPYP